MKKVKELVLEAEKKLEDYYSYYVTHVSNVGHAVTFRLSCFIYFLCNEYKPKVLMDRGSGFSSFVLRLYAKEQNFPVEVYSIDTISKWLQNTKDFLIKNKMDTDNLYLWNDFYPVYKDKKKFDFILEDAEKILRIGTPAEMVSFINLKRGMILWDDAKVYTGIVGRYAGELEMNRYNLPRNFYSRTVSLTTRKTINYLKKAKGLNDYI